MVNYVTVLERAGIFHAEKARIFYHKAFSCRLCLSGGPCDMGCGMITDAPGAHFTLQTAPPDLGLVCANQHARVPLSQPRAWPVKS
jgi:hypothetical protein